MSTDGRADRELERRKAAMFRALGMAADERPLVGAPGSIVRRPVSRARYEANLVELQRQTRSEAKSHAPGVRTFADLKPNSPNEGGPVSLPKMMLQRNQARNAELRRDAAREAAGRREFNFVVDGQMDSRQAARNKRGAEHQTGEKWHKQERAVYDNLTPQSGFADIAGKALASPFTAAGAAIGSLNVAAARLAGNRDARISLGNNAIQFENGLFGKGGSAFTLGNSVLYGPGAYPDLASGERYDGRKTPVTLGDHEKGHTYQFTKPLFPLIYIGSRIAGAINGKYPHYEVEADDFGEEAYRRRK